MEPSWPGSALRQSAAPPGAQRSDSVPLRALERAASPGASIQAKVRSAATGALQRKPQTKEEADEALHQLAVGVWAQPHEILRPADTDDFDLGNCHGFTKTGDCPVVSDGPSAIGVALRENKRIAVFYQANALAHSGVFEGTTLLHYIKGVGLVATPDAEGLTFGYTKGFALPDQLEAWTEFTGIGLEEVKSWGIELDSKLEEAIDALGTLLEDLNYKDSELVPYEDAGVLRYDPSLEIAKELAKKYSSLLAEHGFKYLDVLT